MTKYVNARRVLIQEWVKCQQIMSLRQHTASFIFKTLYFTETEHKRAVLLFPSTAVMWHTKKWDPHLTFRQLCCQPATRVYQMEQTTTQWRATRQDEFQHYFRFIFRSLVEIGRCTLQYIHHDQRIVQMHTIYLYFCVKVHESV